ncbi:MULTISPECIES: DUF4190 domain-containing protein [Curtobacterium]|uniref:DUF4190 domain-containing protein n=1 Tax=Curtobacterium citri TaxID=3055139 RepID=A0ABT7T8K0_9MICO|nr:MULTISPECIES: DUF4190 domain-containing protein [Curtobacterium]MDM7885870.1 DUF4190 domain-containing protein [Curtobacterium citri]
MTAPQDVTPRVNTLAVVAFVLVFFVAFVGSIVGFLALRDIDRTGEGGRALALWAIVLGFVFTAFNIVVGALVLVSILRQG